MGGVLQGDTRGKLILGQRLVEAKDRGCAALHGSGPFRDRATHFLGGNRRTEYLGFRGGGENRIIQVEVWPAPLFPLKRHSERVFICTRNVAGGVGVTRLKHLEHNRAGLQGAHHPCLQLVVRGVVMNLAQNNYLGPFQPDQVLRIVRVDFAGLRGGDPRKPCKQGDQTRNS